MDTRVERALDGELNREELTRAEADVLAAEQSLIARVLSSIPEEPLPDLSRAVLCEIDRLEPLPAAAARTPVRTVKSALAWFWQPRPVALRPAYALAAIIVLTTVVVWRGSAPPAAIPVAAAPTSAAPASAPQVFIQFRLDAPEAQQVALAGDFTDWQPEYELIRSSPGMWTIVVPLKPGVHEYAFIIDGERWTPDPLAPAVQDGFGGVNSRVAVIAPDSRSL